MTEQTPPVIEITGLHKSFGNLHHDVDTVLDTYFHHCALAMSCRELAYAFEHLADGGVSRRLGREWRDGQWAMR